MIKRRFYVALRGLLGVVVLALSACFYSVEGPDVRYAQGYGYVVEVEAQNSFGISQLEGVYYVFDTLEAAQKFAQHVREHPKEVPPPWYREHYGRTQHPQRFGEIGRLLTSPPSGLRDATRAIDPIVPPIPTAPAPR